MSSLRARRTSRRIGRRASPWIRQPPFRPRLPDAVGRPRLLPLPLLRRFSSGSAPPRARRASSSASSVTLLVGGPHMYSTYLRTALEPRFRRRYGLLAYLPLVADPDPRRHRVAVLLPAAADRLLLLGVDPRDAPGAVHLGDLPAPGRARASRRFDRLLDGAVILGALYTVAMYKFVEGQFTLGTSALLFPSFLKRPWVAPGLHRRRSQRSSSSTSSAPTARSAAASRAGRGSSSWRRRWRSRSSSRSSTTWTSRSRASTPGTRCSTSR